MPVQPNHDDNLWPVDLPKNRFSDIEYSRRDMVPTDLQKLLESAQASRESCEREWRNLAKTLSQSSASAALTEWSRKNSRCWDTLTKANLETAPHERWGCVPERLISARQRDGLKGLTNDDLYHLYHGCYYAADKNLMFDAGKCFRSLITAVTAP